MTCGCGQLHRPAVDLVGQQQLERSSQTLFSSPIETRHPWRVVDPLTAAMSSVS